MREKPEVKSEKKVWVDASWPIPDWRISDPESLGFDTDRLVEYGDWLEGTAGAGPYGAVLVRPDGHIAWRAFFHI